MHSFLPKDSNPQKRLLLLSDQLAALKHVLKNHPLVSEKLTILQIHVDFLHLQAKWSVAGPLSRLLVTIQTALRGYRASDSVTGFVGPTFDKLQQAVAQLMQESIRSIDRGKGELLTELNQIVVWGILYLTSQNLSHWRTLFPQRDPDTTKKAGRLFRELSLLFLMNSNFITKFLQAMGKELGLEEKEQKVMADISLFYILLLILVLTEEENKKDEELVDSLHRFMTPTLDSIEYALHNAHNRGKLQDDLFFTAHTQLHVIRLALEKHEINILLKSLENSFEILGLSYQELKNDLKRMELMYNQLSLNFNYIFNQTEAAITTVTQAA